MHIPIRDILSFERTRFVTDLKTSNRVMFEDGVEVMIPHNVLTVMRYLLDTLLLVPEVKITSNYDVRKYFQNGQYVKNTFNKFFKRVITDTVATYRDHKDIFVLVDSLYERMFVVVNNIYNDLAIGKDEYMGSLDIRDFIDIQIDKMLMESKQVLKDNPSEDNIVLVHQTLDTVIRQQKYSNNPVARGYISGNFNRSQISQLLGARGYLVEMNDKLFKMPVTNSFMEGLNTMYDIGIESRSGAKSLHVSTTAIQESEYFAREMQLVCMIISRLSATDCGTTKGDAWTVRETDLKTIVGKYYWDDDGNEKMVGVNDVGLVGKTIKLRGPNSCQHSDREVICHKCFGELAYSIPRHALLGHISPTLLTHIMTQLLLSAKHDTASAKSEGMHLDEVTRTFFTIKDKVGFAIKASRLNKAKTKLVMYIPQNFCVGIGSLKSCDNVYKLNPARISRIDGFVLQVEDLEGNVQSVNPIQVGIKKRWGSFTYEFLDYIKQVGYTLDHLDRYVIDLSEWKEPIPLIKLPLMGFSYLSLVTGVKSEFKYLTTDNKTGVSLETAQSLTQKIHDLVNEKLNINLALIEVIVYAFTTMDVEHDDYRLGRGGENIHPARIGKLITNRSLGGGLGWERFKNTLLSPRSYKGRNAIDHPLDVLLAPNEYVNLSKRGIACSHKNT